MHCATKEKNVATSYLFSPYLCAPNLPKYSLAAAITFGANIMDETIVGIAMRANIPSMKFMTISMVMNEAKMRLKV